MTPTERDRELAREIVSEWLVKGSRAREVLQKHIATALARVREGRDVRSKDHPEANGRKPVDGEYEWRFLFPLDDGTTLTVRTGRVGRDAIIHMAHQERTDDAIEDAASRHRVEG